VRADPAPLRDRLVRAAAALLATHPEGALGPGQSPTAEKDFRHDLSRLRAAMEPGHLDRDWKPWTDLRGLRQTKRTAPTPPGYDALADAVIEAAAGMVSHPGPLQDACPNLTAPVTSAQAIMAGYGARKRDLGVIDYADMIAGCEVLLLGHPDVLAPILGEVDCVIIDEFQDTNPAQFSLLWQLAARAPRCLPVGDAKQSIMGFQVADPRLAQALAAANPGAVDPLRQNWRNDPRLMAAINGVAQGLFGDAYTPLAPTRADRGQPVLEVIALSASRGARKPPKLPDHTAARIAAMLRAGDQVTDRATGARHHVRPGDIAVLCQHHTEAARHAEALRRLGRPVRISAAGWHEAQAVLVARHAMALAADPQDAHAALVVLTLGPAALPLDQALGLLADGALGDHAALHGLLGLAATTQGWTVTDLCLKVTALLRPRAKALPDAAQTLADLARLEALAEEFNASDPDTLAAGLGEGQVAKLVEDDEVEAVQAIGQAALFAGAGFSLQSVDQIDDMVEPAAGAVSDQGAGNGDGQMRFAGSGAADQNDVALIGDEGAGGKVVDQARIDRGAGEVEVVQILCQRQLCDGHLVFDGAGLAYAGGDGGVAHPEAAQGQLLPRLSGAAPDGRDRACDRHRSERAGEG